MSWTEPLMVVSDDEGRCEVGTIDGHLPCPRRAKWRVEPVGWSGPGEPPEDVPSTAACTVHVAAVMTGRL